MLSYQHSYHAGNRADVHKHAILTLLLTQLTQKDKPLTYYETHAGRGFYDLDDQYAQKTGEAAQGIDKILKEEALSSDHPYIALIHKIHHQLGHRKYPGSPMIAGKLLRSIDQMLLNELHPEEFRNLQWRMRKMNPPPKVKVNNHDGNKAVLKWAPPTPARGVVMIDPSYEIKTEYQETAELIKTLHQKWRVGVIMLWYPILDDERHLLMTHLLEQAELPQFHKSEIRFKPIRKGHRLCGSGVILVNTPFQLDVEIDSSAHYIARA